MKTILKHIGIIVGICMVLLIVVLYGLSFYTGHRDTLVTVPDFTDIPIDEVAEMIDDLGLRYEVTDTTFKDGARKMAVINQNPVPEQEVKPGRTIYFVINVDKVPLVEVPDLVGKTSLAQATSMLSRSGIQLGTVIKKPCDFVRSTSDQPVIDIFYHGDSTTLLSGSLIERNTMVDLVICVPEIMPDSTDMLDREDIDIEELF